MNDRIRPPTRTIIPPKPHASRGIGKPYPKEFCKFIMYVHDNHPDQLNSQAVTKAQDAHTYAVNCTINRLLQRRDDLGHVRPFRRTGNQRSSRELKGQALINLALYRAVHCKAFGYEIRAFLFNRNPTTPSCSASQLSRAEKRLGLTTVAASTTANHVHLLINLEKQRMYWEMGYPLGIAYIDIADLIEMDEMGMFVKLTCKEIWENI